MENIFLTWGLWHEVASANPPNDTDIDERRRKHTRQRRARTWKMTSAEFCRECDFENQKTFFVISWHRPVFESDIS